MTHHLVLIKTQNSYFQRGRRCWKRVSASLFLMTLVQSILPLFLSPLENIARFMADQIAFHFSHIQDKTLCIRYILGRKSSFCIFLLVMCDHEYVGVSGEPPALQWRACASHHLDPVTFASKGAPDTSKTGRVLCELGPKKRLCELERSWWTSLRPLSSVPYCTHQC